MYKRYEAWDFAGEWSTLQTGLSPVTAGRLCGEANYEVKPRILKDYYLVWIQKGSGVLHSHGKRFSFRQGDLYMLFPHVVHAYHTDPNNLIEMFWIGFNGVSAAALVAKAGLTPDAPVVSCGGDTAITRSLETLEASGADADRTSGFLCACGALYGILGRLTARLETGDPPRPIAPNRSLLATGAHHFMNVHYREPITIGQVAAHVGVSRATLATLFRDEFGQTPSQYLCYLRMKNAIQLLESSTLTVAEIAHTVGYSDALYFSKVFTLQYGVPPSRYRVLAVENARTAMRM